MSKTKNEMATLYGVGVGSLVDIRASVVKIMSNGMADVEVFYNLAKPPIVVEVPIAALTRVEANGWPAQMAEVMEQRDTAEAEVKLWMRKWEVAEENRGAFTLHAGQMEDQVAKREAEIRRLLDVIEAARDKLDEVIA